MAGNAAGEGELLEQTLYAVLVLRDVGVDLAVRAFQIHIGDQTRAAVTGAGDVDDVEVVFLDQSVEVHVDEVEPKCRSSVAEQARLDVGQFERLFEQRIISQRWIWPTDR